MVLAPETTLAAHPLYSSRPEYEISHFDPRNKTEATQRGFLTGRGKNCKKDAQTKISHLCPNKHHNHDHDQN